MPSLLDFFKSVEIKTLSESTPESTPEPTPEPTHEFHDTVNVNLSNDEILKLKEEIETLKKANAQLLVQGNVGGGNEVSVEDSLYELFLRQMQPNMEGVM